MKKLLKKSTAVLLALIMLLSCGVICASAETGDYYEPQPYQPSSEASEVGFYRYFFLLPDDWCNEYTDSAGIYWWSGSDACGAVDGTGNNVKWPGYKMYKYDDEYANVWYCNVPRDVYAVIFNNALDGGDQAWDNFDSDRYVKAVQTGDIYTEYYEPGDSENYPEGTDNFNNMIFVVDPDKAEESFVSGKLIYGGEWYYYHGNGQWDTQADPVYGGANGEVPEGGPEEPVQTEKTVTGLEILTEPEYVFTAGEEYDITEYLNGMQVKITYSDGETEVYNYDEDRSFFYYELEYELDGNEGWYHTLKDGENVVTVSCGGASDTLTLKAKSVTSLEIITEPEEYGFIAGNYYYLPSYLDGMSVEVTFSDGTSQVYSYDDYDNGGRDFLKNNVNYSGDNLEWGEDFYPVAGENKITVTYGGASAEFSLYAREVTSLEILNEPEYMFIAGEEYYIPDYLNGMQVQVTFTDGDTEIYNYDENPSFFYNCLDYELDGVERWYFTLKNGENIFTVYCGGASAEFSLYAREVTRLNVIAEPEYMFIAGKEYDITEYLYGMQVQLTFTDGEMEIYDYDESRSFFYNKLDYELDGVEGWYHTLKDGENVVTVSCGGASDTLTLRAKSVVSLEIITKPEEYGFIAGNYYYLPSYLDGMSVEITFSDGTSQVYSYDDYENGGNDFFYNRAEFFGDNLDGRSFYPVAGENKITIAYGNASAEFSLNAREVTSLEILTEPDSYDFIAGRYYYLPEYLDGMSVKVTFGDGTSRVYSYDDYEGGGRVNIDINYSGDSIEEWGDFYPVAGENKVTITCGAASAEFSLYAREVTSLEILTEPDSYDFIAGSYYYLPNYLDGMSVKVTFGDGTSQVYSYDDYEGGGRDFFNKVSYSGDSEWGDLIPVAGENKVTITYGTASAEFSLYAREVTSLEILAEPEAYNFIAGNYYYLPSYLDGMSVKVTFDDGTSQVFSYDDYEGGGYDFFDNRAGYSGDNVDGWSFYPVPGENKVTITYGTASAEFSLYAREVTSLEILTEPEAYDFIAGKEYYIPYYLDGMQVKLTYSDGETEVYDYNDNYSFFYRELSYELDGEEGRYHTLEDGENVLTVSCGGASDTLTLNAKSVTSLEILTEPDTYGFIAGNYYYLPNHLDGMSVKVTFGDGISQVFSYDDYEGGGNDFFYDVNYSGDGFDENGDFYPVAGENKVTITYGAASAEFSVYARGVTSIEILTEPEYVFTAGEEYDITEYLDGMQVKITYSDGETEIYDYDEDRSFFYYNLDYELDGEEGWYHTLENGKNTITVSYGGASATLTLTADNGGEKLWSDVNGDGDYNILDAAAIQLYKAKLYNGIFNESVADTNGDGVIDILDAAHIQLDLAKLL